MRLIALAEIVGKEKFTFIFCSNDVTASIKEGIVKFGTYINIYQDEEVLFSNLNSDDIVVIDGYSFDELYQKKIKSIGCTLVNIDDLHNKFYWADIVINHAGGAKREMYRGAPYTKFYLGFSYCLLREEFRLAASRQREIKTLSRAFISFGGSHSSSIYAEKMTKYLLEYKFFEEIRVLLAQGDDPQTFMESVLNNSRVKILQNLHAGQVSELISGSDLAVVPSSTLSFEAYAIGVFMITGLTAENQRDIFNGYEGCDFVFKVNSFDTLNESKLSEAITYFKNLSKPYLIDRQINSDGIKRIFNELLRD
ncbi:MAG: hypothetical protein AABY93_00555 [Bacteroidota bacterium]